MFSLAPECQINIFINHTTKRVVYEGNVTTCTLMLIFNMYVFFSFCAHHSSSSSSPYSQRPLRAVINEEQENTQWNAFRINMLRFNFFLLCFNFSFLCCFSVVIISTLFLLIYWPDRAIHFPYTFTI